MKKFQIGFVFFLAAGLSVLHAKDAEMAQETFMRSIKLGGTYGQTNYKKREYALSTGLPVQNDYAVSYYGPLIGAGLYVVPVNFMHLNLGADVSLTMSDAGIQDSSSKTSISGSLYANLGIRLGDLWPYAGISYQMLALDPRYVMAQGGIELKSGSWVFGGMFAKSVSASEQLASNYSSQQNWYTQVYVSWLWGRWY